MAPRITWWGLLIALGSAASFATSGPVAKGLLQTGWSPGAVVLLRILVGAVVLTLPAWLALGGDWARLRTAAPSVFWFGFAGVAVPQLAFFYAVEYVSVGVALMLEYLGIVLIVLWIWLTTRVRPQRLTLLGLALALAGLGLVLDVFGGLQVHPLGVMFGLIAAVGLASFFWLSAREGREGAPLPPLVLAGGGLWVGGGLLGLAGLVGVLPMDFRTLPAELAGAQVPWWLAVLELGAFAAAASYALGVYGARLLGPKLASFVGLSEVIFAVLFAWLLIGEIPRPVQLLGGLLIVAGVIAVRLDRPVPSERGRTDADLDVRAGSGAILGAGSPAPAAQPR